MVPNSVEGSPAVDPRAGEGPDGAHDKALGTNSMCPQLE